MRPTYNFIIKLEATLRTLVIYEGRQFDVSETGSSLIQSKLVTPTREKSSVKLLAVELKGHPAS